MMDFEDRSAADAEQGNFTQANAAADAPPAARPASPANGPTQVLTPNAQGVVVLPQGVGLDDLHVEGRNLVVVADDGTRYVIPDGAIIVPQLVVEGVAIPALNLAALLVGNEPEPAAGAPRSSGGNFASDVGPLQDAYGLGDLLPYTELSRPEPQEREILPDLIDREPTALFVTPDQPVGASSATSTVSESGLPARGNEPAGSNAAANSEATSGTIVFVAEDGVQSVTLNGVAITAVGQTVTGAHGVLTITSMAPGAYGYSYVLTDNSLGDATTDPFALAVTDADGDIATATLTIAIQDDVPTARSDTDAVAGGSYAPEGGNVITGSGTTSGAAGADTPGADGALVSGVRLGSTGAFTAVPAAGITIQGQYGSLNIAANGGYTYTRAGNTPGGVSDVFTYQLTDGDGDTSAANLTIAIGDSVPAILSIPPAGGAGAVVNESGLPDRGSEAPGSNSPAPTESTSGTITYTQGDAPATVAINGTVVATVGQVITVPGVGSLTITSIAPGAIGYNFTLADNTTGDTTTVVLGVTVTDRDGDVASGNLTINIVDDVPLAVNDSATQGAENAPVTVNVLANDVQGADSVAASAVALVPGTLSGTGQVTYNGNGTFTYTPGPAETGTVTFRYSITDGDGDQSAATVTIQLLADSTPTIRVAGDNDVLEAGLPARAGEPAGSQSAGDGEVANGTIAVASGNDSLASLVINGVNVTNGGTVTTAKGILTVAHVGADYTYSYRLADNTLSDPDSASFAVKVTDSDGSTASTTLTIAIIDDVPTALADTDTVAAGSFAAETGNVITGSGTTSGAAGADTPGADGARVSFAGTLAGGVVVAGSNHAVPAGGSSVFVGQYGTLTLSADGSYSYTRNTDTPGGVEDKFFYVLTDGDGDNAPTTLTIAITDSAPGVATPAAGGATTTVYETALPAHAGGPQGTSEAAAPGLNDDPREAVTGTVTFHSADGIDTLTVAGTQLTGTFPQVVSSDATGTLVITAGSYDPVTGDGSLSYTYTLANNTLTDPSSVTFPITLTDIDGDAATSNLTIAIIDDAPLAVNDAATQPAEDANVTIDVFANDVRGADGALASSVTLVAGSQVGAGVLTNNGDGTFTLDPVPGQTGTVTFQYTMTDGDGDVSLATATITLLADSTPNAAVAGDLVVDEDGLAGANVDAVPLQAAPFETDSTESASATGSVVVSFGNDVPASPLGAFALLDTAGLDGQLVALNGTPVTFALGTGADAGVLIGKAGATEAIRIFVTGATAGPGAGQVTYSYATVLSQPVQHTGQGEGTDVLSGVSFQVTDADGDPLAAPGTFSVTVVDDVPTALADTDTVAAGSFAAEAGNVITGAGTTSGAAGADTPGADGARVSFAGTLAGGVVVAGSNHAVPAGGSSVFVGQYGTLTLSADGSYSYTRNTDTPGGVEDKFFYVLTDGDGDNAPTTLTIAITDSAPGVATPAAGGATTTVYETALPAHAGGPQGTSEAAAPGLNDDPREAVTGTVTFHSADGIDTLTVAGTQLTGTFPQVVSSDATGTLVITAGSYDPVTGDGSLSYTYTLANNTLTDPSSVTFPITLTDIDGDAATSNLTIAIIDDAPVAADDADAVTEGLGNAADGNVFTGTGGSDANASDGVADNIGADGAAVGGAVVGARAGTEGAGGALSAVTAGGVTIAGTYGDLLIRSDGSYTYTLKTASIPAAVTSEVFTYQIKDGDGDLDLAQLTITLNQDLLKPDVAGDTGTVYEDGLADGVQHGAASETDTTGQFTVNANGESYTLTLDGDLNPAQTITAVGQQVVTSKGVLEITSISAPVAGVVTYGYKYTLSAAQTHTGQGEINPLSDTIAMTVTDATGDSDATPGSIVISIVDDVPVAADDANAVTEGLGHATSGNVYDGVGASAGDVADTIGADVPAANTEVTGARAGTEGAGGALSAVTAGGVTIAGTYGDLLIRSDGSYTYTLKTASIPAAVTSEVFTYQIKDGDGDLDLAQLTITLNQDLLKPDVAGDTSTVYEDGLADGVQHGAASETDTTGQFTVNANGESYTLTLDGDLNPAQTITAVGQQVVTSKGVLEITSISAPVAGVVTYGYKYTLSAAQTHTGQGEINPLSDTIAMTVTDATGDSDATPGSIVISIVDDVPVAADDANAVTEGLGHATSGNVYDGVGASAGDVADTIGADVPAANTEVTGARAGTEGAGGALSAVTAGGVTIAGTYGDLLIRSDGSYTYTLKTASIPAAVTSEVFTYQIKDGDGDLDLAQLTITLNQDLLKPDVAGDTGTVYEDGLADGVQHGAASETDTTGQFTVNANGESYTLTLDGDLNPAQTITAVGQQVVTSKGVLEITSISAPVAGVVTYGYKYTLSAAQTHTGQGEINPLSDTIAMTVTDATGDSDATPGSIVISIVDDVPVAADDANAVTEGLGHATSGNVYDGVGASAGDVADTIGADVPAANTEVTGARAGTEGAGGALSAVTAGGVTIAGTYGDLLIRSDGSYTYTLKTASIPAAVTSEVFTYQIKDGDGDLDLAQLTITLNQDLLKPDVAGDTGTVYEDGLADGVQHGAASETDTTGQFTVNANGESYTLTLDGDLNPAQTITAVGQQVVTSKGVLEITSISAPVAGVVTYGYKYTLSAAQTHTGQGEINPLSDTITMTVTDATGDSDATPGSIVISIVDDVPVAADDANAVTEGLGHATSGNVSDGVGASAGDVADTIGADVPAVNTEVTGARAGTEGAGGALSAVTAGGVTIAGTYGDLLIRSDGSYTYTLKTASIPAAVTSEVFTYQIKDGDGDLDLAQLTITLNQDLLKPDVAGDTGTVYEDGLADGVQHGAASETDTTGQFTVNANGESYTLTLDGDLNPAQTITAVGQQVVTSKGVLEITSISAPVAGVVTYGYKYTLSAAQTHTGQGEINPLSDTIAMTVTDATGDSDATPGSIVISIVDDVPVAADDANAVTEGLGHATSGNVYDGVGASAGDVADTIGADVPAANTEVTGARAGTEGAGGALSAVTAGGVTIAGTYGDLLIRSDGSYTYTLKTASIPAAVTSEVFTYQIKDGDGDLDLAQLTITLNQDLLKPDVAGDTGTVYEDGLADGVQHGAASETDTTGQFTVNANGESYTLTLDGDLNPAQTITAVGQQVVTSKGVLEITSISAPVAGVVTYGYKYTLSAAQTHTGQGEINPLSDTITMTVTDATGDSDATPGSIVISIVDDVPVAADDANAVTEGLGHATSGNVYDGVGASAGDVADTIGADVPAANTEVTGARAGTEGAGGALSAVTAGGVTIAGTYGDLLIRSDGSYTYTLKTASIPAAVTSEVFTYQIKDGDGDLDLAQLTITLNQDLLKPDVAGDTGTVYEDGLADGVQHGAASETDTTGQFTVNANGESYTLTLDGDLNPAQTITAVGQQVVTSKGVLEITSISAPVAGVVTYGYKYTLSAAQTHTGQGEINPLSDTIAMTVTDATGDSDATPGSIVISIVDDVPVAVAAKAASLNNAVNSTGGNYLDADNDVDNNFGADGGKVIFTSATQAGLISQNLTSGLATLNYAISGNGTILTATKSTDASVVFTIALQPVGSPDQYTVTIAQKLDSTSTVDFNGGGYDFVGGNGSWAGFTQPAVNPSQDLLLTPIGGGTVNTNANEGGVASGNSVGAGESMRVDFVIDLTGSPVSGGNFYGGDNTQSFTGHYVANGASALFTSINTSSIVTIKTFDDADTGVLKNVGDGVHDTITSIVISHGAVNTVVSANGTYVVDGISYTVAFSGGDVTVSGVADGTRLAAFTATGYNSIEFGYGGGNTFKIGDFGATTISNTPVDFTVPISVQDGDGDIVPSGNLAIHLNPTTPPIALDLDGDGVEFSSLSGGTTFDYGGGLVHTAWVAGDDGLLALDINHNYRVDGASEVNFGANGMTDLQGLAAQYDNNHDGMLDASDAAFDQFGVWQDANSDGVSDPGEFRTLGDMGITSIGLISDGHAYAAADGDVTVTGQATFLRNGSNFALADAAFATASADRRSAEIATTTAVAAAVLLPTELAAAATPSPGAEDVTHVAPAPASEPLAEVAAPSEPITSERHEWFTDLTPEAARPEHVAHTQEEPLAAKPWSQLEDHGGSGDSSANQGSEPVAELATPYHPMSDPGVSAMDALLALTAQGTGASQVELAQEHEIVKEALGDHANEALVDSIVNHFVVGDDGPNTVIAAGNFAPAILSDNIDGHVVAVGTGAELIDDAALALALTHA